MQIKLDAVQTIAVHTIESAGLSAIVTVAAGLWQYVGTHGLNVPQLTTVAGAAFLGALVTVYKSLSKNPQVIAGVNDTIPQIWESVQNIESALIPGVTPRATSVSTKAVNAAPQPLVLGTPDVSDHAG